jgi:hypothetical protein
MGENPFIGKGLFFPLKRPGNSGRGPSVKKGTAGLPALLALALALCPSCGQGLPAREDPAREAVAPIGEIVLRMPDLPGAWAGLAEARGISLNLYMVDSGGRRLLASGLPFSGRARLAAPSGPMAVFLAEPEGERIALKPAGALYPLGARGAVLELSFLGGWTATCAVELLAADPGLAYSFNWPKLEAEASERLGDPWLCPPRGAAERIAAGDFGARDISPQALFPVEVPLGARSAAPGAQLCWRPESPFAPAAAESGGILRASLPEGAHILYREGERLSVVLDGEGRAGAFLIPD